MKPKKGRTCRRCQAPKKEAEFGFIYCEECEVDLNHDVLIKRYAPRLCVHCEKRMKQPRSEYCKLCYETEFDIKEKRG